MHKIWPVTPNYIKRALRAVGLVARSIEVTWTRHTTGRIRFHVELALKYSIIPAAELKDRLSAAFVDRVIERRALFKKYHVSLDFTLDCSRWSLT